MSEKTQPYWLEVPLVKGELGPPPKTASIVVIGSGFTGSSAGYFLQQKGFENVVIIDDSPEDSATYRNCGHILFGTVESMKAFSEIHGAQKSRDLWAYSIELCDRVGQTIKDLNIDCDYRREGYLVVAVNEAEDRECRESVRLLNSADFPSEYWDAERVSKLGFKTKFGARYEAGSADAHPTKFRNGIISKFLSDGGCYFSGVNVQKLLDVGDGVEIHTSRGLIKAEAVVLATNAYSPLVSDFFRERRLIEPFRGQIITSKPLKHNFKVRYPHSFDHGYEYAVVTPDNRLMIGGWRNHTATREVGTYDLEPNKYIVQGLKTFVHDTYEISEKIEWEYSWSGIMGASSTSLPFVGPTNSDRIYACGGYTGHGFSWGHGSAYLLSQIMAGESLPDVAKFFNPKTLLK